MATIRRMPFVRHLSSEPNEHVLLFRKGRLVGQGVGVSYWFVPLTAAIAQVPTEDLETTFLLSERTRDHQEVNVQVTIAYRAVDPERLARRVDFGVSLETGRWLERPLDRLAAIWRQRVQDPVRTLIGDVTLVEALTAGPRALRAAIEGAVAADEDLTDMGLAPVKVQVDNVSAIPELDKALQTPAREQLQEKADQAMFQRRALAVEKERTIRENELQTEIELEARQEDLIEQRTRNERLTVEREVEAERLRVEATVERQRVVAEGEARDQRVRSQAEAASIEATMGARAKGEAQRLEAWRGAPARVLIGLALQELAQNIDGIQHLNITPNFLGEAFQQMLTEGGEA